MFSDFFINRPVFAKVVSIIIIIAGLMGLRQLPIEEYPKLIPPIVMVSAAYPGADATTIAQSVATPIENAVNGVENMIYMQSTSSASGAMSLSIFFTNETDPQEALVNVNNRIRAAEKLLPAEVQRLGVNVASRGTNMLEVVSFYDPSGNMDIIDLNNYINLNVVDEIKRIPGVGGASVVGSKDYSMRIWIKPDMIEKFKLTTNEVVAAIKEQNTQYAAGKIAEAPMTDKNAYVYTIRADSRLKTTKEFENIIIRASDDGKFLYLKDVADIELGAENYSFTGALGENESAPMLVFLQNNANALEVAKLVSKKLEQLSAKFPGELTYKIPYDITKFVEISIAEVVKTFIEAMLLVTLVVYLFLGNFRATIIPMIAVPVSIIGALGGLYVLGFSINLITLFALILAIGIVVDDAIIVIENVERILEEELNLSVKEATSKAMKEIFAPVISIVLVLSAVFVPVAFMGGLAGAIQKQFALTLVISVAISGFVALTLTPALCATMLSRHRDEKWWFIRKFNEFFDFSTRVFSAGVVKILKHIIPSLICVGIMMFAVVKLFDIVPKGLVPDEDKGTNIVIVSLPPGATIERTKAVMKDMISTIKDNENIEEVVSLMGYDMFAGTLRENAGVMFFKLKDWSERKGVGTSSKEIANELNKKFYANTQAKIFVLNPPPINGLSMTGGFELFAQNLNGKSYNEIEQDMKKLIAKANQRPELMMVRTTLETTFPQYDLKLDTQKAKMLGINISDIFSTLSVNLSQYYINDINLLGKTFKVNMRAKAEYRDSINDINKIFVKNNKGEMIPISSVASLKRTLGSDSVDRFNGFPAAKVMGSPKPGYTSADAIRVISEIFNEMYPSEYSIGWSGTAYQEVNSQGQGGIAFILGIVFVFLILAAQYERWLMPLAIITAVPFSVFGSLIATWARGLSNDLYFNIGLLILIGLSAKNAILIVEFAMQEHLKAKKPIFEAAVNAARLRFRPIVMTSLAFTLGVLPMVLSSGAGAASRHALGTGVIGGMIAASTIAIFFVPMFFYLLEGFNNWISNRKKA